jgi:hypothetical protein
MTCTELVNRSAALNRLSGVLCACGWRLTLAQCKDIPRGKNEVSHKAIIQIAEIRKFLLNIPNTHADSYGNDSHAVFHAPCIPRMVSYESLHVTPRAAEQIPNIA